MHCTAVTIADFGTRLSGWGDRLPRTDFVGPCHRLSDIIRRVSTVAKIARD